MTRDKSSRATRRKATGTGTVSSARTKHKAKKGPAAKKIEQQKNKDEIENQLVVDGAGDEGPAFYLFPKLPIELRRKIFGFAAPEPFLVVQRSYANSKHLSSWIRPVPAILHACHESREEFLETDTRRKSSHPLYKLSFHNGRRSSPIFFSTEIDIFWCSHTDVRFSYQHAVLWSVKKLSTVINLDIAKSVRNVVLDVPSYVRAAGDVNLFLDLFQNLETLTLLLEAVRTYDRSATPPRFGYSIYWDYTVGNRINLGVVLPAEEEGELGTASLTEEAKSRLESFKDVFLDPIRSMKAKKGLTGWVPPVIKFRLQKQYMDVMGETTGPGFQHNSRTNDLTEDAEFERMLE